MFLHTCCPIHIQLIHLHLSRQPTRHGFPVPTRCPSSTCCWNRCEDRSGSWFAKILASMKRATYTNQSLDICLLVLRAWPQGGGFDLEIQPFRLAFPVLELHHRGNTSLMQLAKHILQLIALLVASSLYSQGPRRSLDPSALVSTGSSNM